MNTCQNLDSLQRRRAAAIVLVAVMVPVLLGFAVLTIDVGVLYNARADMQNAADAGALSAANILGSTIGGNEVTLARAEALAIIQRHSTLGRELSVAPSDIVFGRIYHDELANTFSFTPTETGPDAVRIAVRSSTGSVNGPVPLFFASIFGKSTADVEARATAALTGLRDIAVAVDLSGSMKWDSELKYYEDRNINLRDVWCSLNGPLPNRPYIPGDEGDTQYATDTGPTIGVMNTWGNSLNSGSYNPLTDPGLWYIPASANCTEPDITASLTARGYNATRRSQIMAGPSSTWANRAAVMIGLAAWTPSSGGDTSVSSSELTWITYPSYRKTWTWADYLDWSTGNNNGVTDEDDDFEYQFGVKMFTGFLLDQEDYFGDTNLTMTPLQPMQGAKDGVQEFVNQSRSFDQMSLEIFASTAHHEIDLSSDRQGVADRLYNMQPNYYDSRTNIGGGLQSAINELTGPRARPKAQKIIVLLSDGASTMGPDPETVAQTAADEDIIVYTISVGASADRTVMQNIAAITGGQEFYAQGTPGEYAALLQSIFRGIAGLGNATLIE